MKPIVTVIITTFNRKETLKVAIESVLKQDYSNIQLIVSDNASEDGTDVYMAEVLKVHPNTLYIRRPVNLGAHPNGFLAYKEHAKGKYMLYLSDDDWLEDERFLSEAVKVLEEEDRVAMVGGEVQLYFPNAHKRVTPFTIPRSQKIGARDYLLRSSTAHHQHTHPPLISLFIVFRKAHLDSNPFFETLPYGDISIRYYHLLYGDVYFLNRTFGVYTTNVVNSDSARFDKAMDGLEKILELCDIMVNAFGERHPHRLEFFRQRITKKMVDDSIQHFLSFALMGKTKSQKREVWNIFWRHLKQLNIKVRHPLVWKIFKTYRLNSYVFKNALDVVREHALERVSLKQRVKLLIVKIFELIA